MDYIIFDLEATCWDKNDPLAGTQNEITEIGAVKLNDAFEVMDTFQTFVKPKLHPVLSDFAKRLTSIRQEDIDQAPSYAVAVKAFQAFCGRDVLLCSWGFYDKKQLRLDSELHHLDAGWTRNHMSIKHEFAKARNIRPCGMDAALKMLKLPLQGTHHRAIDDARNIAEIFRLVAPELETIRKLRG